MSDTGLKFLVGERVIFRENENGPAEPGWIVEDVGPTTSHPNGGEYVVLLEYDQGVVQAWSGEITKVGHRLHYWSQDVDAETWSVYVEDYVQPDDAEPIDGSQRFIATYPNEAEAVYMAHWLQRLTPVI